MKLEFYTTDRAVIIRINFYNIFLQILISDGCENKKCEFYATCESNGAAEGRCVCPHSCEDAAVSNKVCNNKTNLKILSIFKIPKLTLNQV